VAGISAKDVKALRDQSGAGMMDCKRALTDAEGDLERATELLRERGLSKAGKRAGRATSEGIIGIAISGGTAGIIELGCETDFVAKTDDFQGLAQEIAEAVSSGDAGDSPEKALELSLGSDSVGQRITDRIATLGENIELKRVATLTADGGAASGYVHAGGKLGVIVSLSGSGDLSAAGKDIAMHVAATDPTPVAVDRDGVPADQLEAERRVLQAQAEQSGKPEKVIEKMVEGRLNKFYSEHCLLEQPFVKDPDKSVGAMLKDVASDASIGGFVRFKLGEASES
jgi:elongation factor Ts